MRSPFILGIRPPVYCFRTVYPMFMPSGLLAVLAAVEEAGYRVGLLDFYGNQKKIEAKQVTTPSVIAHVDRPYYRYGLPVDSPVMSPDDDGVNPSVILLTSGITYWYMGLVEVISYCRRQWPGVPIVLGGTYATLWPAHARGLGADYVISGEGENAVLDLLNNLTGYRTSYRLNPQDLDSYPVPLWRLTGGLKDRYITGKMISYQTSKGCCFNCTYCASNTIYSYGYRRATPRKVIMDLEYLAKGLKLNWINFQDDQLLHKSDEFFKPLLRLLAASPVMRRLKYTAPNSIDCSFVDEELAGLFRSAGFAKVYVSIEVSDPEEQKRMGRNPKTEDVERAIDLFHRAGYGARDIFVYILMGLPGQRREAVVDTIVKVWSMGAIPSVLTYTPIPSTVEWQRAVDAGWWADDADPLIFDIGCVPCQSRGLSFADATSMRKHAMYIRRAIMGGANMFGPGDVDNLLLSAVGKWSGNGAVVTQSEKKYEETRSDDNVPLGLGGQYFRLDSDTCKNMGVKNPYDPLFSIGQVIAKGLPISRRSLMRWDDVLHPVMVKGERWYSFYGLRVLEYMLSMKLKGIRTHEIKADVARLKSAGVLEEPAFNS